MDLLLFVYRPIYCKDKYSLEVEGNRNLGCGDSSVSAPRLQARGDEGRGLGEIMLSALAGAFVNDGKA